VTVTYRGATRTWAEHIDHASGYSDEEQLVQPRVFPLFAEEFLDFQVGVTLAAENVDRGGRPDFTPADAVTHPFIFETKSTSLRAQLNGWDHQVLRYLQGSSRRIKRVVLTNLVGIRVFELDATGTGLNELLAVDLAALLQGDLDAAAELGSAQHFAEVLRRYRRQQLSPEQKLQRAREAPPWVPALETTDAEWLSARLDSVVLNLIADVRAQVAAGALTDEARVSDADRSVIEDELRQLEWRIADTPEVPSHTLSEYLGAAVTSNAGKALAQYEAHVAYFCATRLLLVRVFEDLDLLDPVLYDGGLDEWLTRLNDAIPDVVDHSFRRARESYPSLFDQSNAYTWFAPGRDALVEVLYELANTYLGALESDVLGSVYERLLERVDRKLLGQYYTPRDVIALIWDLLDADALMAEAENNWRPLRVLDIASGSGGFLVDGARRLRTRLQSQMSEGAAVTAADWVRITARGLTGVEIQRFPAYLGELNLLIQMALGASVGLQHGETRPAIPPLGIICHDTLATHNPIDLLGGAGDGLPDDRGQMNDPARQQRYIDLCDPSANNVWYDVAIGNPPYVGEKAAARMIARTRERMPYWNAYHALHMDYLSWFLVLGISKLRKGGSFGFITSEYWLRATGASKLRRYLAQHCEIDRLVLFRDMRLFPDAPGQHSLVVTGRRVVDPGDLPEDAEPASAERRPTVSFIQPRAARELNLRPTALDGVRGAASNMAVRSFGARVAPGPLLGGSWAEVIMTRDQLSRRKRMRALGNPLLNVSDEGVITGADRLGTADRDRLSQATLARLDADELRGIFVLTEQEVATLGELTEGERERVRLIVNTRDVYPYACLPDEHGNRMLYLPDPAKLAEAGGEDDAPAFDFRAEMPSLAAHLEQFKPILEAKVQAYGENRPWWTIHRGRPRIGAAEGSHKRWAGYALTARWGEQQRLTVGLAPRHGIPQSSLHALIPVQEATAAYLVGIFNSSPVQQLTDALGPGQLRMEELFDLGVPLLDEPDRRAISEAGFELAETVSELVRTFGARWPALASALRADPSLSSFTMDAWSPASLPAARSGPLSRVHWIAEVHPARGTRTPIREVLIEQTLFGAQVVAKGDGTRQQDFRLTDPEDHDLQAALEAVMRGAQATGRELRDLADLTVPIDAAELRQALATDREALEGKLNRYHELREDIDARVYARLG
jgi:hypothetical protein